MHQAEANLAASAVRTPVTVQSYVDGFLAVAVIVFSALVLVAPLRPPPVGPASLQPLFTRRSRAAGAPSGPG